MRNIFLNKNISFLKLRIALLIFTFSYTINVYCLSGADSSDGVFSTVWQDLKYAGNDYLRTFNYLITPSKNHILYPITVADYTFISSALDEKLRVCPCIRRDIPILKQAGEISTAVALPTAIYLSGLIFKDEYTRTTGRLLFESMLLSGTLNTSLKVIFGRARPNMDMGNGKFEFFEMNDSYQSLPSGHTCAAFTSAALLAGRIDNIWINAGLYMIAAGTAFERIYSNKHWFSDVILGATIGIFSSKIILSAYDDNEKKKDRSQVIQPEESIKWSVLPQYNYRGANLTLLLSW